MQLEDFVLEGIIAISEGKPLEETMQSLHTQISSLMGDLGKDHDALTWFKLSTDSSDDSSTPPAPEYPSASFHNHLRDQFHGQ